MISLINQREEAIKQLYISRSIAEELEPNLDRDATIKTMSEVRQKELQDALTMLKEWYMLLVKASALAFEFEYWKRIGK